MSDVRSILTGTTKNVRFYLMCNLRLEMKGMAKHFRHMQIF